MRNFLQSQIEEIGKEHDYNWRDMAQVIVELQEQVDNIIDQREKAEDEIITLKNEIESLTLDKDK